MLNIATNFKQSMQRIIDYVDLSVATFDLAKADTKSFRSKLPIADATRNLHTKARAISTLGLSLACEGAYLSACAQFEQAVRDVIEETASQCIQKKIQFTLLPPKMQENHINGCGLILQNISSDKFSHLSPSRVVSALHNCVVPGAGPASLVVEAFSSNERNFKPKIVSEHIGRLGLQKLWGLLGKEPSIQSHFGTTSAADAEKFSRERLERIMDKRNTIIHRGKNFAAPTDAEVKEHAEFFTSLIEGLARVLTDYVAKL